MKRTLSNVQILGFVFTGIMGVVLHFLHDLTGQSVLSAPFSAVNESIWEHMKILFFPMFLFAVWEKRKIPKDTGSFWCIKFFGILRGLWLIPVLYYTGNGALGPLPDPVNIAIFFVTTALVYIFETWLYTKSVLSCRMPSVFRFLLYLIAFLFVFWTFFPPHVPLFRDPMTGTYGYIR